MSDTEHHHEQARKLRDFSGVAHWLKSLLNRKPESEDEEESLRGALEEYIDVLSAQQQPEDEETAASQERTLLSNVLDLRHTTVANIMVPRADIVALDVATPPDQFVAVLVEKHHSRVPLYRESLDDIVGIVHIKDVLAILAQGKTWLLKILSAKPLLFPLRFLSCKLWL
jgi:CBS domain containing-hemolysin-like protein